VAAKRQVFMPRPAREDSLVAAGIGRGSIFHLTLEVIMLAGYPAWLCVAVQMRGGPGA
jgi:hypothetical protein